MTVLVEPTRRRLHMGAQLADRVTKICHPLYRSQPHLQRLGDRPVIRFQQYRLLTIHRHRTAVARD